jgi:tetratricopeptide (TPR) repeat protein
MLFKKADPLFVFLITVVFAANPLHTEVVSSLKNRDELLGFLFSLITVYYSLIFVEKRKWGLLPIIFIFYVLALFSKITAVSFIAIIPLLVYYFRDFKMKYLLVLVVLLIGTFVLCKFGPKLYLDSPYRPKLFIENPLLFNDNPFIRIATSLYILLFYLRLVIFPHPLRFYYGYNMIPLQDFASPWVWVSLLVHAGLLVLVIYQIKKKTILSFGILLYLVSIFMYSNFYRPPMGIIADRFLYVPSLGFSIVLSWLIYSIMKVKTDYVLAKPLKSLLIVPFILIVLLYSIKTIVRNDQWKDQLTLLRSDIKYLSNSAKANYIYAGTIISDVFEKLRRGDHVDRNMDEIMLAVGHLKKAVEVYPVYYEAYNKLGEIYYMFLRRMDTAVYRDSAIYFLQKSTSIDPDFSIGYYNMGFIYKDMKHPRQAIVYFSKAIKCYPGFSQYYNELGNMYMMIGEKEKAEENFRMANEAKSFVKKGKRKSKKERIRELPHFSGFDK